MCCKPGSRATASALAPLGGSTGRAPGRHRGAVVPRRGAAVGAGRGLGFIDPGVAGAAKKCASAVVVVDEFRWLTAIHSPAAVIHGGGAPAFSAWVAHLQSVPGQATAG